MVFDKKLGLFYFIVWWILMDCSLSIDLDSVAIFTNLDIKKPNELGRIYIIL